MSLDINIQTFWEKALENISSAASEFANRRYNASANRAYYACFQAAIVALMREGIRPQGGEWGHAFVQAQFAGKLVTRRTAYPAFLRDTLPRLGELREHADYEATHVSQTLAQRALRRAREFIDAVERGGEKV